MHACMHACISMATFCSDIMQLHINTLYYDHEHGNMLDQKFFYYELLVGFTCHLVNSFYYFKVCLYAHEFEGCIYTFPVISKGM